MDLKNYKEIIIDGKIMKSLSVAGREIWNGVPDDLYLIRKGVNESGADWISNTGKAVVSYPSGIMRVRTQVGPYDTQAWTVTNQATVDVTEFSKMHVIVKTTQSQKSGWPSLYHRVTIGGLTLDLGNGVSSETNRDLDISELTGEQRVKLEGKDYGDSSTSQTYHSTEIVSIWFSAE